MNNVGAGELAFVGMAFVVASHHLQLHLKYLHSVKWVSHAFILKNVGKMAYVLGINFVLVIQIYFQIFE